MFKNKLFLKIVIIFTLPVLGILYFSSVLSFEKIELIHEVEYNKSKLAYVKIVDKLISSLEKEQNLSLEYLSSNTTIGELNRQQEISKKVLIELDNFKEQNPEFIKYRLNVEKLVLLREEINSLKTTSKEILKNFNQTTKMLVDSLILIRFKNLSNNFRTDLVEIYDFLNLNENIKGVSEFFTPMIEQLETEILTFNEDANFQRNQSIVYMFFCFFTLISLFFVLKNIILSEQKSFSEIRKHKQVYEVLNLANKFLLKTLDRDRLYSNICELISDNEFLQYCFIYDHYSKSVISKNRELENMFISLVENQDLSQNSIVSKIMKYEINIILNNFKEKNDSIFYKDATKLGINSMGAFPIRKFDKIVGVLIIYSKELDFFDKEVEVLFDKLVDDITRCLEKIKYENVRLEQESESRLYSYAFESSAPMIITDSKNDIIKVNQSFCRLMGYSRDDIIGNNPSMFKSSHQDLEYAKNLWDSLKINGNWSGDVYDKRANDEVIALKATITAIKDQDNKITNYLGQYMDNSEQKDKEKFLEHQATHDTLTGLPNRLLLIDRIGHAIKKAVRYKVFGGLIFIDLDNFKTVNDTLGHNVGDTLLITVAKKIKQTLRDEDTVARIGGDEFIVLVDKIGSKQEEAKENIIKLSQKIKDALNTITHIEGHKNPSTPSIGATLFNDESMSVNNIIKQADTAMYSAKSKGKNTIEFF